MDNRPTFVSPYGSSIQLSPTPTNADIQVMIEDNRPRLSPSVVIPKIRTPPPYVPSPIRSIDLTPIDYSQLSKINNLSPTPINRSPVYPVLRDSPTVMNRSPLVTSSNMTNASPVTLNMSNASDMTYASPFNRSFNMSPISNMNLPKISPMSPSQSMISPVSMQKPVSQLTPMNPGQMEYVSPFESLPADMIVPMNQPPPMAPKQAMLGSKLNQDNQIATQLINNSRYM